MPRRSSQTFTVSLPADLAAEVDRIADEENRSRSELVREAFRQYAERRRRWEQIFRYGQEAAAREGIRSEAEVAVIVKERRRSR